MGDEIREINGINVSTQTIENLQKLLVINKNYLDYKMYLFD